MANKPIIRFNEYSDEWEEITLSDIAEIVDRKTDEQSNAPVMMISAASGFINQSEKYSTDNAGSSLKNYILLKKGELAYNHGYSALRNFGSCFTLEKEEARIPFVYHCFSIPSQNPYFYGYYLNCGIFDKQLRKLVASTARMDGLLNISYSDYTSIKVKKPSENEQKELATFFKNINNLIISTQEKLEKAIIFKKSMLEKMFTNDESKKPEIRFKGFSDDWIEKSFSEITFPSGEKNKDNLPYDSYSITNENGFILQNEQFENGGNMFTADKTMYWIVTPNSFAYNPARINVGSIGYYDGKENVIISSLYEIFKISNTCDSSFLIYWFKTNNFQKQIQRLQEGGVRLYFYYDKLCMSKIKIPTLPEQEKIGQFFLQLDKTISSYEDELEKLKTIKKSLLEKMFV